MILHVRGNFKHQSHVFTITPQFSKFHTPALCNSMPRGYVRYAGQALRASFSSLMKRSRFGMCDFKQAGAYAAGDEEPRLRARKPELDLTAKRIERFGNWRTTKKPRADQMFARSPAIAQGSESTVSMFSGVNAYHAASAFLFCRSIADRNSASVAALLSTV